ncbi:hypothetical protein P4H39_18735 [Paenibacillus lautus]|uniref:hypothetical protein n=1 Tax=Paenibacillus lautus TaxID=1401 RepID=UPI002DBD132D|nr:hypothetical protein [Paenibacillus lautus]MEC0204643.1 hypothetical protein [Paenibacillus lautus]
MPLSIGMIRQNLSRYVLLSHEVAAAMQLGGTDVSDCFCFLEIQPPDRGRMPEA